MKQIINKYPNGNIAYKYCINDSGQRHGLCISYYCNNNLFYKINFINNKEYGLITWWYNNSNKVIKHKYYL